MTKITKNFVLKAIYDALFKLEVGGSKLEKHLLSLDVETGHFTYGDKIPANLLIAKVDEGAKLNAPFQLILSSSFLSTDEMWSLNDVVQNALGNHVEITLD